MRSLATTQKIQEHLTDVHHYTPEMAVLAVVVTFRPTEMLLENLRLLLAQVSHVVLVDNASCESSLHVLRQAAALPAVTLINNAVNEGIARALNQGLQYGINHNYRWFITFDQDSTVTDGMVECMLSCFGLGIGIVAPSYIDRNLGSRLGEDRDDSGKVRTVLSSGMLMPRHVLEQVGLMNELLFIDSVDHEFCARVISQGYQLVQTDRACLLHTLGRLSHLRLFGRNFEVTNHSAARKYYQVRNRLWTMGFPRANMTWWSLAAREAKSIMWDFLKVLLAEEDRWNKVRLMRLGVWHAFTGRMGKTIEP